ncbi:YifB family Mg chelatase-like AAA ATPase [bacterium]|nr:YifB family Mg chelatase-like AAA ATPase [bacterium]
MSKIYSAALNGIEGKIIEIETDISYGLVAFHIVGLPDNAVKEAKVRVMSAIKNSGFDTIQKKITLNLAPADIRKDGTGFDLPIAIALLSALGAVSEKRAQEFLIAGELSLFGDVRDIYGALPMALKAKEVGLKGVIIPKDNIYEASLVDGISVYGVSTLEETVMFLNGELDLEVAEPHYFAKERFYKYDFDFEEVKGQFLARRAIEIAVAGQHNIALIGAPGSGKTMLARRVPTILPKMSFDEMMETLKIYSASGIAKKKSLFYRERPYRSPHHTISDVGLIGGGIHPKAGEISLAHNGVLFLDEFFEFKPQALEGLRQPLEDGEVTISRANYNVTFPASTMLIAAMNPCPCGYYGDTTQQCKCTQFEIAKYQKKLSGPVSDRIDIMIQVPSVKYESLISETGGESSEKIRERVIKAYNIQKDRYINEKYDFNGKMSASGIKKYCILTSEAKKFWSFALQKLNISARRYGKTLKVARTIADLDNSKSIESNHISEAIQIQASFF